jgi:hypothetical protein
MPSAAARTLSNGNQGLCSVRQFAPIFDESVGREFDAQVARTSDLCDADWGQQRQDSSRWHAAADAPKLRTGDFTSTKSFEIKSTAYVQVFQILFLSVLLLAGLLACVLITGGH